MSSVPLDQDGAAHEADVVSALAARVRAIEDFVQTTTEIVDEKALKELRRTIEALAKRDPKFEERVTNKVDVIADRIETVAKTVSTASASVAANDGEIAHLRRELEAGLNQVSKAVIEARHGTEPAELVEIRRTLDDLSKLSKQRMPRGLEDRIDELEAKFALVSQRVDSVSSTVSNTASGLAGRDGDVNALRRALETESDRVGVQLAELRQGIDPAAMADLRQALKEVADEGSRRQHSSRQLLGQTGAKVDALAGKLDSLATSLESSTSRVAATEEGLSAFRTYFEDAGGRLSALLAEHNRSLAALSARTEALEKSDAEAVQAVEERVGEVGDKLERLAGRLETSEQASGEAARLLDDRISAASDRVEEFVGQLEPLGSAVQAATVRLDARDDALHAMELRFQDASARVDGLVAELSRALAELPDPDSIERALATRIDEIAGRTASLTDHVGRVETSVLEQLLTSTSSSAEIERLDEELVTVRRQLEEAGGRLGSVVAEQKQLLAELGARTVALEQADGQALRELDDRVSGAEDEASALRDLVEIAGTRMTSLLAEHRQSLATLSARTASLEQAESDALSAIDERISATADRVDELASRLDALAGGVEGAATSLADKEHELAALHRHFTDSSTRVETIVDDIREALSAFPAAGPAVVEELSAHVERMAAGVASLTNRVERREAASREAADIRERTTRELAARIDVVDEHVAAVAAEVARAKTLWPVALRSLEARLDDAATRARRPEKTSEEAETASVASDAGDDDLLADLRESLRAMESVTEELERASETPPAHGARAEPVAHEAVAGGARIVPLRPGDP